MGVHPRPLLPRGRSLQPQETAGRGRSFAGHTWSWLLIGPLGVEEGEVSVVRAVGVEVGRDSESSHVQEDYIEKSSMRLTSRVKLAGLL